MRTFNPSGARWILGFGTVKPGTKCVAVLLDRCEPAPTLVYSFGDALGGRRMGEMARD
jgi:hypothetical protein